jgi:hypothetical protein
MSGPNNGKSEQDERIEQNLDDVNYDFRGMNYDQFQDLFEDRDPFEFI